MRRDEIGKQFVAQMLACKAAHPEVWLQDTKDASALAAVAEQGMAHANRIACVRDFLQQYSVLMGFPAEARLRVAETVVNFADESRGRSISAAEEVLDAFRELRPKLLAHAPVRRDGQHHRDVMSLTSKALWLCFPEAVPILDAYAESALTVLVRQLFPDAAIQGDRYESFVRRWYLLWAALEPFLSREDFPEVSYKVRVLDKYLWYLGVPVAN